MASAAAGSTTLGEERSSWLPMIVIGMGQALMSFNVASIPISMGGMVESFNTPPTTVGTAIVLYSLGVSGFIMLGGRLGQRFGSKIFFQSAVGMFLGAMILMVISPSAEIMLAAQLLAGLAGAALVPTLVVLIANHYTGKQQAEALGWLGSARAMAGVLAFTVIGFLERFVSWRAAFGLLIAHAAAILFLSFRLKPSVGRPEIQIDIIGVLLSATSIIMITFGVNNIRNWGGLVASPGAPFDLLGLSPAPMLIVIGIFIGTAFFLWTARRERLEQTPLFALKVLRSPQEWAAVLAMFTIVAFEAAINFSVPLYIQIVQGSDSFQTAMAMMPFNLTVFFTAVLVVRLYNRFTPRTIAQLGFALVTGAALWLAFVINNDWQTLPVIIGLVAFGIGQGALVTLVFNVLVTSVPKSYAADVGSMRGVTQNMAAAVGTALAGAFLVALLSAFILRSVADNAVLTSELRDQVNLTNLNFFSDEQLRTRLANTTANEAEFEEALRINAEARTRALKIGFLLISGLAFLAILPCAWLPNYKPGEVPVNTPPAKPQDE
jgi:MFS family permease